MPKFRKHLEHHLRAALESASIDLPAGMPVEIVPTADTRFGDYQSNVAMTIAKALKADPREIAGKIVEHFRPEGRCDPPQVAGPGFLNFRVSRTAIEGAIAGLMSDPRLGVPAVDRPRRIVIDFSAPNVAKPMHVGHIRSTFIGDALARIARFVGHEVITDNHIGDWGTQFGMIIHGWKSRLDHAALERDAIHELVRVYRAVNAEAQADERVLEFCKQELVRLQQGDPGNMAIWRECVKLTLDQLHRVYARLGIEFDHYLGESFYNDALAPMAEKLLASKIAIVDDGAVCVFSDGAAPHANDPFLIGRDGRWEPAPCLVRKSDGGFLYSTTDLATIEHRVREFKAEEVWYVVGAPQQLHFRQVFEIARRLGHTVRMVHIPFGSILGPDGKMFKTRSGQSVGLLEVVDEIVERARAVVEARELDDAEKDAIAECIGIAAVKYAELSQHRMTDYKFVWEKMLSLHGNTAPYLINAYVRIRSIFRKLDGAPPGTGPCSIGEAAERELALKLARFGEAVHDVLGDFRPNLLAQYLYELADIFHAFYEGCPVLRAEGVARDTRLALCEVTGRILKHGLGLLGIRTTERM